MLDFWKNVCEGRPASTRVTQDGSDPRHIHAALSALHDIGYVLPGARGRPTQLIYLELNRRGLAVWRAA